jgi:signal transduction histidine kinase
MARKRVAADFSGCTILVVDDQEEALVSVRLLLEREGHRVLTATGGEEALALFCPGEVHLVIVDYFMPRMNGEDLVHAIRALDEDVQILLQTGYAGEKPPREMLWLLDIQGYHDKSEGPGRLLLWVDVALKAIAHLKKIRDAEREMEESRMQLRSLSMRLLRVQEEEREQIGRELHDHLGQLLTAIGMEVEWIRRRCLDETSRVLQRLQEAGRLAQEAIEVTRELSATLWPRALKELGLEAALRESVAEFSRRSEVSTHFASGVTELNGIPDETVISVYRVVQEALTNVARHAVATHVTVDLRQTGRALTASVTDDGTGFVATSQSALHSLGLAGMRERARLVGGELAVHSDPGVGTTVTLCVPLTAEGKDA